VVNPLLSGNATSIMGCQSIIPSQSGGTHFAVNSGSTASGIDLAVLGTFVFGTSEADTGIIKLGPGVMALENTNTFKLSTTVSNGTLLLLNNGATNASLTNGSAVVVAAAGGNGPGGGIFGGNGTVGGAVTVAGTIEPGTGPTTGNIIGTLTCSNGVTLSGTNVMKINAALGTNDVLAVAGGALVYGGTLAITNLSGTLTTNSAFPLYTFVTAPTGGFTNIVPTSPGPGLAWNTNTLTTDGTLRIVTAAIQKSPPAITGVSLSGTTLNITATNGVPSGNYVLLESTNLSLPLAQWTRVSTNAFNASGVANLSITNGVNTTNAAEFFIMYQ